MKNSYAILLAGLAAAGMLLASVAGAQSAHEGHEAKAAQKAAPQTKCPVMGGDVNKALFVDYGGKRIYVCCPGCLDAIKKDPAKFVKELEAKGIVLDKAK
jgi:YHS domain-containing protein